jgi:hypothetical protein
MVFASSASSNPSRITESQQTCFQMSRYPKLDQMFGDPFGKPPAPIPISWHIPNVNFQPLVMMRGAFYAIRH